ARRHCRALPFQWTAGESNPAWEVRKPPLALRRGPEHSSPRLGRFARFRQPAPGPERFRYFEDHLFGDHATASDPLGLGQQAEFKEAGDSPALDRKKVC